MRSMMEIFRVRRTQRTVLGKFLSADVARLLKWSLESKNRLAKRCSSSGSQVMSMDDLGSVFPSGCGSDTQDVDCLRFDVHTI